MTKERAILACDCFWGMRDLIHKLPDVLSTRITYTGSDADNTTYPNHGKYTETIEIKVNNAANSYRDILL